jgi:hypothetical protein
VEQLPQEVVPQIHLDKIKVDKTALTVKVEKMELKVKDLI